MIQNEELINLEKIALGDHEAFHSVFIKYFPKVKYFITHMIKSEDIAKDLSQDIFFKVWLSKKDLPNLRSLNAYLYKMAKNAALNYLEHKYIENAFAVNYNWRPVTTPEEELNAKDLELLIRIAVERMPKQRRKIYMMSRVENIKNREIAKTLKLAEKTVNNQLSLALKDIRDILALAILFFL